MSGWVGDGPIGAIVIAGSTASNGASQITLAGANTGSNNRRHATYLRSMITFTGRMDKHQIESGVWLQRLQSNDFLAQNQFGQASFSTLAALRRQGREVHGRAAADRAWMAFVVCAGFIEETWKVDSAAGASCRAAGGGNKWLERSA